MTKLGHREVKPGKQGFGFTCWLSGKESAHQCRRHRLDPWVRKIPWKKWQPTAVFLPGKSHGQRSLSGYSPWGHKGSDTAEWLNNNKSKALHSGQLSPEAIFFLVFWYPVSPTPFVEEVVLSPFCGLGIQVQNHYTIESTQGFVSGLYNSICRCLSLFQWHCFDYCSFEMYFEINSMRFPTLFLLCKDYLWFFRVSWDSI